MRTLIHAVAASALVAGALGSPTAFAKPMQPVLGVVINKPKPPGPPVLGVPVKPPKGVLGIVIPHPHPDHDHWGSGWWWWHHHQSPWIVEEPVPMRTAPVATRTVPMATPSVSGPCTCLTKTYLGDGSVQFQDICTKEAAIGTPRG
jgi:hypothetical protein